MSDRAWKNGPINGAYLRDCKRAELRRRPINGSAAIAKKSKLAGKVVAVPPAKCGNAPEKSCE
jgi:hypothetical protein